MVLPGFELERAIIDKGLAQYGINRGALGGLAFEALGDKFLQFV